jgi:tryptophan-rich sensory protein
MLAIFVKPTIIAIILTPVIFGFKSLNLAWVDIAILAGAAVISLIIWMGVSYGLYRNRLKSINEVLRLRFNAKV